MYVCKSSVMIVICIYAGIADTADKCRCKTCKEGYMLIKGDGALLSQSVVSLAGGQYLDVPPASSAVSDTSGKMTQVRASTTTARERNGRLKQRNTLRAHAIFKNKASDGKR
jgi:hypothetical protein